MMFERGYKEDIVRPASTDFAVGGMEPQFDLSQFAVQPTAQIAETSLPAIKSGTAAMPAISEDAFVVDRFPTTAQDFSVRSNPTAVSPQMPTQPDFSVGGGPAGDAISKVLSQVAPQQTDPNAPDFGMYSRSASAYRAPELQPASGQYATPYYAAYTNDGDFAGAVMVGADQGVRLVDAKTGEVVFQGSGPEAAKQAVGVANAVSDDRGRKAAWRIEADYGDKGWVTQAAERYDPKKSGFFGTLADIALPILGAALMPLTGGLSGALAAGLGAAGGSAISSVAQGRGLTDTLLRAGLSGLGAGVVGPGVNTALAPLRQGAMQGALQVGAQGAGQAAAQIGSQAAANAVAQGAGNLLTEVVINGVRTLVPAAIAQGIGAGAGSLVGGALSGGSGSDSLVGNIRSDTLQPQGQPTTLEEFVVEGVRGGMTPEQLVALGIPATLVTAALTNAGAGAGGTLPSENVLDEVVIQGEPPISVSPIAAAGTAAGVGGLMTAIKSGDPSQVGNWVKEHPLQAAGLGLTAGSALLGGAGSGGGGAYGILTGNGAPGTRSSLSPIYSAGLPAAQFGVRTPRDDMWLNKRYAIQRPEASFFEQVPQRGPERFAVPTPDEIALQGIGDVNGDGQLTAADREAWRKRFRGYAEGGRVRPKTKNEKSVIDYHRDVLRNGRQLINPDGSVTTFRGAVVPWTKGSSAVIPTYWDGEELSVEDAVRRAKDSKIPWPSYRTVREALSAEERLHKIMEQDIDNSYAEGGSVSDGRSDDIDAKLSDGEYVIDAETVALLGNGSSRAGADALDRFRVMVRKHKGRDLAKGKFSVDAHEPHRYLEAR